MPSAKLIATNQKWENLWGAQGNRRGTTRDTSAMTGDCRVRFCETLGTKLPGATPPLTRRF
jgi:hypothetical protein